MATWAIISAVSAVVPVLYGLHRLGLYMEKRGWINYRKTGGGLAGAGMAELQALTQPNIRHLQEAMREEKPGQKEEKESGDPKP